MDSGAEELAPRDVEADPHADVARRNPPWTIELPTPPMSGPAQPVQDVRRLFQAHRAKLVESGVYSQEELDAQIDGAEVSWAAESDRMFGPLTTVARIGGGEVIGGVELWQQQRDKFWFLEGLIRNPAAEFKGVGIDLFQSAFRWWMENFADFGEPLKVHSMVREESAVRWWTWQIGRDPDFTDAYIRNGDYYFEAVGWILYQG